VSQQVIQSAIGKEIVGLYSFIQPPDSYNFWLALEKG